MVIVKQTTFQYLSLNIQRHWTISLDNINQLALAYSPGASYIYFWGRQSSKYPPKIWQVEPSSVVFMNDYCGKNGRSDTILQLDKSVETHINFCSAETGNIVLQHVHIFNTIWKYSIITEISFKHYGEFCYYPSPTIPPGKEWNLLSNPPPPL